MKRLLLLPLVAAALAGCSDTPAGANFDREAGAVLRTGSFGDATMTNHLVMTGQYRLALANRFAAEVDSTVTFAFDSAALSAAARATLQRQAAWIRQFPEARFKVFGHTDLVGSDAYNRQLGLRRAQAVVAYLTSLGVDRGRLEAVVSYGEQRPLIVTQGPERRNRRTVTEVSGFVGGHPMVLNGKYAEVIFREYVNSAQPQSTLSGTELGGGGEG